MNKIQIQNMFLGLSLADALGVPVEFESREDLMQNPVNSMRGFGTYNQPEGTWSDDSSLAFCLAESLQKGYDLKDMAIKFIQWRSEEVWTPHGRVFDIGIQTNKAIDRLVRILNTGDEESLAYLKYEDDEYTNGNGSLMRVLPLLYCIKGREIQEQFEVIWEVSALTHGHIRSAISCLVYLKFAEYISDGNAVQLAYQKTRVAIQKFFLVQEVSEYEQEKFKRIITEDISQLSETEINSGGYVIDTLEASFWCLLNTKSYLEAVFKAINLGHDTDTTATVVGGVAGLYYGMEEVPQEWIDSLARKKDIIKLSEDYLETYASW